MSIANKQGNVRSSKQIDKCKLILQNPIENDGDNSYNLLGSPGNIMYHLGGNTNKMVFGVYDANGEALPGTRFYQLLRPEGNYIIQEVGRVESVNTDRPFKTLKV